MVSAPVDDAWHRLLGRDAVLWSPPHLLAVAATLALVVGLLAGLQQTASRSAAIARLVGGAAVLGALQLPVLEYDTDVPQFPAVWYYPVATLGLAVGYLLVRDLLGRFRAVLAAAAVYTTLRILIAVALVALGNSSTMVPPLLACLLLLAPLQHLRALAQLVLLGVATPTLWWVSSLPQSTVTTVVPATELVAAVPLSVGAALLAGVLHGDLRPPRAAWSRRDSASASAALVLLLVCAALVLPAAPALAHDPGQGPRVLRAQMTVTHNGTTATVTLALPVSCDSISPIGAVARRAGTEHRGPLTLTKQAGSCVASGDVHVDQAGRWFVYAELDREQSARADRAEAWLPVRPGTTVSVERVVYAPAQPETRVLLRDATGAGLLLAVIGLLLTVMRLSRRVADRRS
ncbi:hypothetical protein H9X94_16770 [Micromonospora aurantiaca]|nr:hypothetical protein [Micromonospora aurantiaca]